MTQQRALFSKSIFTNDVFQNWNGVKIGLYSLDFNLVAKETFDIISDVKNEPLFLIDEGHLDESLVVWLAVLDHYIDNSNSGETLLREEILVMDCWREED